MRYFKKELWAQINSGDSSIRKQASEEFDQNCILYAENLEAIKPRLSKAALKFFTKESLHDGRILSFVVGDAINIDTSNINKFDWNKRELKVAINVINDTGDKIYQLKYTGINKVIFDHPTDKPLFNDYGGRIDDWGYDELTVVNDKYLRHEILFSSGAIISIEFKTFNYKTFKSKTSKK